MLSKLRDFSAMIFRILELILLSFVEEYKKLEKGGVAKIPKSVELFLVSRGAAKGSCVNICQGMPRGLDSQPVSTMASFFSSFLRCLRWFFSLSFFFIYFGQCFACKGPVQLIISEGIPRNLYFCFKLPSWVLDHYNSCISQISTGYATAISNCTFPQIEFILWSQKWVLPSKVPIGIKDTTFHAITWAEV